MRNKALYMEAGAWEKKLYTRTETEHKELRY